MVMAATVPGQLAALRRPVPAGQESSSSSCAGVDRSCSLGTTDAELARLLDPGARFPGVELVAAAVGLFPRDVVPSGLIQRGREGRDFVLQVGPGTIGLRLSDGERKARAEAADPAACRYGAGDGLDLGDVLAGARLLDGLAAPGTMVSTMAEWGRAARDAAALDDDEDLVPGDHRARLIVEWTAKSRRSMTRCLAELDYAPMFAAGATPAMVTLTYPGDWLTVAPGGSVVKGHVRALIRRWARAWHRCTSDCGLRVRRGRRVPAVKRGNGRWSCTRCRALNTACTCGPSVGVHLAFVHVDSGLPPHLWKLEFQRRGAPHLHLFAVPPAGEVNGQRFAAWLSHAWADIVGHPDPEQRRRHRLAGTGVDYKEGARATDPKRLAVYFTKHGGAAGGKEYQHRVPAAWLRDAHGRAPADEGYTFPVDGPGRFWGYSGLDRVMGEVLVTQERYVLARRTLRRLAAAKRMTRTSRVPRADTTTGVIVWRTVTRRTGYLTHGGLAGGWLCVNDGPGTASALARWLVDDAPPLAPAPWGPQDLEGRYRALSRSAARRRLSGPVSGRFP